MENCMAKFLRFVFICLIYVVSHAYGQNTYYVDASSGNDVNSGRSENNAWQTLAKINSASFLPGDTILFKKGEIWRKQLTIPSSGTVGSPITFGAYGAGATPIIPSSLSLAPIIPETWVEWLCVGVYVLYLTENILLDHFSKLHNSGVIMQ